MLRLGDEDGVHLHEIFAQVVVLARPGLDPLAPKSDVPTRGLPGVAVVAATPRVPRVGRLPTVGAGKEGAVFGIHPSHPRDVVDADQLLAVLALAHIFNMHVYH